MQKENKKSILLTRSKEENKYLQESFDGKGYKCIECSLLEYRNVKFDYGILNKYQNLIITSKYAARLLPDEFTKNLSIWVVGNVSADILSDKGYKIKHIASNAGDLKEHLSCDYNKTIYLSGNYITTEMPDGVIRHVVYKVDYLQKLSNKQIKQLQSGIDYILLYSENCAKTLINLLVDNDLLKYLEKSVVIAISSKVAKIVSKYFSETIICNDMSKITEFVTDYDRKNG